jgi:4-hydroxyphenylpyruvate dioxygenase
MDAYTDNPMKLDGFQYVEFCAPEKGVVEPVFEMLGFELIAKHRSKDVNLWRQGDIDFVINYEPSSLASFYAEEHGPSVCGLAFRVKDAHYAYNRALELGAQPVEIPTGPMELRLPAIRGIGGIPIYLVDRYQPGSSIYDIDFNFIEGIDQYPTGAGLQLVDHLTHNVYRGRVDYWAKYYEKLFNFSEIRQFKIKGQKSGLFSRAMAAPDNKIRIPLNEESSGAGAGQIDEFLMLYNGEGIQHIAFSTPDLFTVLDRLKAKGLPIMPPPPDTYYEMLDQRLPHHGQSLAQLKASGVLLDGSTDNGDIRLLLQIFSKPLIGPIFFEFIERQRDEGFGEGNFQALFEPIEQDQIKRGALG